MTVFTDRFLRGLRPNDSGYEERDNACSGLIIRVNKRGRKVWELILARDGKRRRVRIGQYPDVSLAAARRKAGELKSDPSVAAAPMRMFELFAMYEAERAPELRAWRDVEMAWRLWAEPRIGNVRLEDLSIRHGADLVSHVSRNSSPARARAVVRYISPVLSFAAGRGLMHRNPWRDLALPAGHASRDRVLSRDEWSAVAEWAAAQSYPWRPFVQFLMLSAQRLGDVSGMRWSEIEGDLWTIPAARHKSKRLHEVPLSGALQAILDAVPRYGDFVFSTRPGTPIAPGTDLRKRLHLETGTTGWRLHDLRRSGATRMGDAGVERFIIERVLGHRDQHITGIYDRATYRAPKRRALEVLAATVSPP